MGKLESRVSSKSQGSFLKSHFVPHTFQFKETDWDKKKMMENTNKSDHFPPLKTNGNTVTPEQNSVSPGATNYWSH